MSFHVAFDHLHQATHYLDHLDDVYPVNIGFNYFDFLKESLAMDIYSVFVTNYTINPYADLIFILRCERNQIELFEKTTLTQSNIIYNFFDKTITLNKNVMDDLFLNFFKNRLSEIVMDLKTQKAVIFEEKLH